MAYADVARRIPHLHPNPLGEVVELVGAGREWLAAQGATVVHADLTEAHHARAAESVTARQRDGVVGRVQAYQALVGLERLFRLAQQPHVRRRCHHAGVAAAFVRRPVGPLARIHLLAVHYDRAVAVPHFAASSAPARRALGAAARAVVARLLALGLASHGVVENAVRPIESAVRLILHPATPPRHHAPGRPCQRRRTNGQ